MALVTDKRLRLLVEDLRDEEFRLTHQMKAFGPVPDYFDQRPHEYRQLHRRRRALRKLIPLLEFVTATYEAEARVRAAKTEAKTEAA